MKTVKKLKPKISVSCNGISDHLEISKVTKLRQFISIYLAVGIKFCRSFNLLRTLKRKTSRRTETGPPWWSSDWDPLLPMQGT